MSNITRCSRDDDKTCSIIGCGKRANAKRMCSKHYHSMVRYGDPLAAKTKSPNGTGWIESTGYRRIAGVGEHILVAEKALGHSLPTGAEVHHVDECRSNNKPTNLVICPSVAYHKLLHIRMRARDACGNPNFRKCIHCGVWDDASALRRNKGNGGHYHLPCAAKYQRNRKGSA